MPGIRKIGINTHIFGMGGVNHGPVQLTIAYVATQFVFKWKAPAGSFLTFNNGNGTTSTVEGDGTLKTHTTDYAGAGTYDFWISRDVTDLTYVDINTQTFVSGDISGWSALINLTTIYTFTTGVTGDISGWSALTSLIGLRCNVTALSGNISSWVTLTSITDIRLNSTSVSGDVSGWHTLTSLSVLRLQVTNVTFDNTPSWTLSSAANLYFHDCTMTSIQVDNMIASLKTCTSSTINLAGTNAARTSASDADKVVLLDNGNSLTVNE